MPCLLIGIPTACGGADEEAQPFAVTDSAEVRIVVSEGPSWPDGEEWRLSESPIVEIGAVDEDAPNQLHNVEGLTRLTDGRFVVLDGGSSELRMFDSDGDHLTTVGGPGQGPGEIERASGLLRTHADTLGVAMLANWAVSWFTSAGEFVRLDRLDSGALVEAAGRLWGCPGRPPDLLPDATFLGCVGEIPNRSQVAGAERGGHQLVRVPYDVSWIDTVGEIRGLHTNVRFSSGPTQVAAGGDPLRIFLGDPAFFEIDVMRDRAGLEASIRYPGGLRPVEADDRAAYETYLEEWRASVPPGVATPSTDDDVYPPAMPGFSALHYDPEGYLWAVEYAPPWDQPRGALVFSVEGPLQGRLDLPRGFEIHEIGADYVLGLWRDELDVEFVRMYGLERD